MRQTARQAGFTLIEVSLAIVIGMIVLAGAVVLYQQSRTSAINAAAKEKVMSLALLVEEMEQRNFALPSMTQLRQFWKTRRPDDYNMSPWGGAFTVTGDNFIAGNDNIIALTDAEIGSGPGGTPFPGTTIADRGRLYYFKRSAAASGANAQYLWLHELSVYGPEQTESVYRMRGFGVAMLGPEAQQWYYIAGKEKNNDPSVQRNTAQGSIGD